MTYIIAEPCVDIMDQSCVSVCPVDCIHFEEGVGPDALHRPGRMHRLRRLRARVPGDGHLPRGFRPRRPGQATPRSTRSGTRTRPPPGPPSTSGSPPDACSRDQPPRARRSPASTPRRRFRQPRWRPAALVRRAHRVHESGRARPHAVEQHGRAEDARRGHRRQDHEDGRGSRGRPPPSPRGWSAETPRTRSIVAGAVSGNSASAQDEWASRGRVGDTVKRMSGMTAKKPKKPEYCCASRLPGAMAPMAAKMAP